MSGKSGEAQFDQLHRSDDAVPPTTLAQLSIVVSDACTSVGSVAKLEALSDETGEPGISLADP